MLDRILQLCDKEKIKIAQLERELGFGNGTIKRWAGSYPGADKVLKVANHFGVTTDYLLTGKEIGESANERTENL